MSQSLATELLSDVDMKYADTYVLDAEGNPVYFYRTGEDGSGRVLNNNDETLFYPLDQLFVPELPWGYVNNLSGSNYISFRRTANRTVKKGVCNSNIQASMAIGFNSLRAYLNPSFSTWDRLKVGTKKGALSRMFAVNGRMIVDFNNNHVATITNELITLSQRVSRQYRTYLERALTSLVGEGVIVSSDDERVQHAPSPDLEEEDEAFTISSYLREMGIGSIHSRYEERNRDSVDNVLRNMIDTAEMLRDFEDDEDEVI